AGAARDRRNVCLGPRSSRAKGDAPCGRPANGRDISATRNRGSPELNGKTTTWPGEPGGARTRDPVLKRHMLYHLSYRPKARRTIDALTSSIISSAVLWMRERPVVSIKRRQRQPSERLKPAACYDGCKPSPMRTLTVLGSTGSIGTNTLDVVRRNLHQYRVY